MNSDLRNFVTQYLSIVLGTLMSVSFFAFIAIPYNLAGHPGENPMAQAPTVVTAAALQV
ncbi:hypothetical protein [Rhodoferax sp.]|uniref:hypothetical protein n=1 Tax=Rhodoferax sp. TaxID=50421 RepID=UPI00262BC821|nr:hypothetical protein [Rhodoferax sp.]MDD2919202.1 hypothetical protein [Rhodoferax sp.]